FSSRRRHTRWPRDWSSDVCSSDLLLHQHIQLGADITLATKPVARHQVVEFGIMQSGVDRRITGFIEKPSDQSGVQEMKMGRELRSEERRVGKECRYVS